MPAGCDFICKNEECEHNGKGIVIIAPWPLGDINKIIDAPNVSKHEQLRNELLKLKIEGRKYACINYPNIDEIGTEGYRVHKWCSKCNRLWTYDAMVQDENETIEDTLGKADIPEKCLICDAVLQDFNSLVSEDGVGINCPHCKKPMVMSTWFSNETTEEQ